MGSLILQIAARQLKPILLILSLIVFYRGHNEPGGGFIGGLLAGTAYVLYAIAFGTKKAMRSLILKPSTLVATGLLIALISALLPVFQGLPFFTGLWAKIQIPLLGVLKLGTPMLFDFGVFLTVAGMLQVVMFSIMEE